MTANATLAQHVSGPAAFLLAIVVSLYLQASIKPKFFPQIFHVHPCFNLSWFNLVSEPLDPMSEGSREGSSSHDGFGGVISNGRRTLIDKYRILSIEGILGALLGTALDLTGRFDQFEGRFEKFEKILEELTRVRRDS